LFAGGGHCLSGNAGLKSEGFELREDAGFLRNAFVSVVLVHVCSRSGEDYSAYGFGWRFLSSIRRRHDSELRVIMIVGVKDLMFGTWERERSQARI